MNENQLYQAWEVKESAGPLQLLVVNEMETDAPEEKNANKKRNSRKLEIQQASENTDTSAYRRYAGLRRLDISKTKI